MNVVSLLDRALKHHKAGRLEEAELIYREILASQPEHADALHFLGMIAAQRGQLAQAVDLIDRAIRLDPAVPAYHGNLGNLLGAQGQYDGAVDAYRRALELRFDHDILDSLAEILFAHGPVEQAVEVYLQALVARPGDSRARKQLVTLLRTVRPIGPWGELESELISCFESEDVDHQHLAGITANQLRFRYALPGQVSLEERGGDSFLDALADDSLLLSLLTQTVNVDFELECLLTELRRHILRGYLETEHIPKARIPLIGALALQCFNNEHVFNVDPDELQEVEGLADRVCAGFVTDGESSREDMEGCVTLLACYVPLASLPCASGLAELDVTGWSRFSRDLVERALVEPLCELEIECEVESLGNIEDQISKAVRAQYEENPYPRWLRIGRSGEGNLKSVLAARFRDFGAPAFLDGAVRVLVAGCGTGKEPIGFALSNPDSDVLAVDLSRRSLAYATRMARKLRATNVRFLQADILNLGQLDDRFHVISSAGVLHHMADPMAGWRVLSDRLLPSGIMQVNLYSECARRPFVDAQKEIEKRGLRATSQDIRSFRTFVLSGAYEGSLGDFTSGVDFYTMSSCRDLLFHVQEHRFSLAQIKEALDTLGLRLVGFDPSHLHVPRGALAELLREHDPDDFSVWERLELRYPRAFLSMYRFWCQKPE